MQKVEEEIFTIGLFRCQCIYPSEGENPVRKDPPYLKIDLKDPNKDWVFKNLTNETIDGMISVLESLKEIE